MARQDYMPLTDAGMAELFIHVRDNLPGFFATLAISATTAEVIAQAADATAFRFVFDQQQRLLAAAQQATSAKDRLRDGDLTLPHVAVSLAFPSAPGTVPSPVTPGVVRRFRAWVKWLGTRPGYTAAIGEALKIIGDEEAAADPLTAQPVITLRLSGGQVEVVWPKGKFDAVEIQVDRGGGWTFLAIDTRPNYTDKEPLPATPGKWKYRAIYRLNDERVGQWSAVADIMVGA